MSRANNRRKIINATLGALVVSRYTKSIGIVTEVIANPNYKNQKLILVKWQNMENQTCEDPSDTLSINEA